MKMEMTSQRISMLFVLRGMLCCNSMLASVLPALLLFAQSWRETHDLEKWPQFIWNCKLYMIFKTLVASSSQHSLWRPWNDNSFISHMFPPATNDSSYYPMVRIQFGSYSAHRSTPFRTITVLPIRYHGPCVHVLHASLSRRVCLLDSNSAR